MLPFATRFQLDKFLRGSQHAPIFFYRYRWKRPKVDASIFRHGAKSYLSLGRDCGQFSSPRLTLKSWQFASFSSEQVPQTIIWKIWTLPLLNKLFNNFIQSGISWKVFNSIGMKEFRLKYVSTACCKKYNFYDSLCLNNALSLKRSWENVAGFDLKLQILFLVIQKRKLRFYKVRRYLTFRLFSQRNLTKADTKESKNRNSENLMIENVAVRDDRAYVWWRLSHTW